MKRTLTFLRCLAVSPVVPSQTKPVVQSRIQLDFAQQEQDQITSDRFLQKEDTLVLVGKKTIKRVDLKTGTFIQSVPINLPESVEDNERMISPDGANLLVFGNYLSKAKTDRVKHPASIWDLKTGKQVAVLD